MLQPILDFFIPRKINKIRLSSNLESYLHMRMEKLLCGRWGCLYLSI